MYLYFNKTTFKALIMLWLQMGCNKTLDYMARFGSVDNYVKWLMENFMPIKFIRDMDRAHYEMTHKEGK